MPVVAGLSDAVKITVDEARVVTFMGVEHKVYATPSIVSDLEFACRNFLKMHLPGNQDSVGVRVEIDHLRATPLGAEVVHKISVKTVTGNLITFDVEVRDIETVALARHVRAVVELDRFKENLASKRARMAAASAAASNAS